MGIRVEDAWMGTEATGDTTADRPEDAETRRPVFWSSRLRVTESPVPWFASLNAGFSSSANSELLSAVETNVLAPLVQD